MFQMYLVVKFRKEIWMICDEKYRTGNATDILKTRNTCSFFFLSKSYLELFTLKTSSRCCQQWHSESRSESEQQNVEAGGTENTWAALESCVEIQTKRTKWWDSSKQMCFTFKWKLINCLVSPPFMYICRNSTELRVLSVSVQNR